MTSVSKEIATSRSRCLALYEAIRAEADAATLLAASHFNDSRRARHPLQRAIALARGAGAIAEAQALLMLGRGALKPSHDGFESDDYDAVDPGSLATSDFVDAAMLRLGPFFLPIENQSLATVLCDLQKRGLLAYSAYSDHCVELCVTDAGQDLLDASKAVQS